MSNPQGQSSQSTQSDPNTPQPQTEKEVAAEEKAQEKAAAKEAGESSKTTAKNDDYNPDQDPIVPDSQLAQVIRVELENGSSPTLDALRDAKKDAEKK